MTAREPAVAEPPDAAYAALRGQMDRDGFCVVPGVLGDARLEGLHRLAERKLRDEPRENLERFAHHGSLIPVHYDDAELADVLTAPELHRALAGLGMADPRWINGYVIAKPPRSPGLWWHQDWWAWGHPRTYTRVTTQIFCMIYLEPTSPENGCLRAIPGSHLGRHPLHGALPEPHTVEIEAAAPGSVAHTAVDDEIDIVAAPGDLVIGDVRVLHATHPNTTGARRTAVDLLLAPNFRDLPREFRAHYVNQFCLPPVGWWREPGDPLGLGALRDVLPVYDGPGSEQMMSYCRRPHWPEDR